MRTSGGAVAILRHGVHVDMIGCHRSAEVHSPAAERCAWLTKGSLVWQLSEANVEFDTSSVRISSTGDIALTGFACLESGLISDLKRLIRSLRNGRILIHL
jgi:hypothetical protein